MSKRFWAALAVLVLLVLSSSASADQGQAIDCSGRTADSPIVYWNPATNSYNLAPVSGVTYVQVCPGVFYPASPTPTPTMTATPTSVPIPTVVWISPSPTPTQVYFPLTTPTPTISAQPNTIVLSGNGLTYLPKGYYNISSPIIMSASYQTLAGEGRTATTINSAGAWAVQVIRSGGEVIEDGGIRDLRLSVNGKGGIYYGKTISAFVTERVRVYGIGTIGIFADAGSWTGGATMYSSWRDISLTGNLTPGSIGFMGYGNFNAVSLDRVTAGSLDTGFKFIGGAGIKLSNPSAESGRIGIDVGRAVDGMTVDTGYFEANTEYDIWIHSENAAQPVRGVVINGGYFNGANVTKCAVYISGYVESVTMVGLRSWNHTQGRVCIDPGVSQGMRILDLNSISTDGEKDYRDNNTAGRLVRYAPQTLLALPASDSTPDISASQSWKGNQPQPVTVTFFDGAFPGQEILIYCYNSNMTIQHSGAIILKGGINFTCSPGIFIRLMADANGSDATWYEVSRN